MPGDFVWRGDQFMTRTQAIARDAVEKGGVLFQRAVKDELNKGASNIQSGGQPSAVGDPPNKSSGTLARSIQIDRSLLRNAKNPKVAVGTNVEYARIHEFGGMIRPVTKKALAVPIGVQGRRAARNAGSAGIGSLNLTFIDRSSKGLPPLLVKPPGNAERKGAKTEVLFVLLPSVYMPKRPYMRPTYTRMHDRIVAIIRNTILMKLRGK